MQSQMVVLLRCDEKSTQMHAMQYKFRHGFSVYVISDFLMYFTRGNYFKKI